MGQQVFATNSLGGFFTNNTLSQQLRYKAQSMQKFRQFVDFEAAAGANRGNKVFFDKISNISTAGGTLVETDTIPKRNYTILQGTLTMTEYGNSIPYTQKVKTLADIQVPETIRQVLTNDMKVVMDSAAATQFMTNDYIATITNTSTTTFGSSGTKVATAGANMSDKNVRGIIELDQRSLRLLRGEGSVDDDCPAIHRGSRSLLWLSLRGRDELPLKHRRIKRSLR